MSKPKKFWLKRKVKSGECDEIWKVPMPEETYLNVIEKSAYDKAIGALFNVMESPGNLMQSRIITIETAYNVLKELGELDD